jgi:hypothetical protein
MIMDAYSNSIKKWLTDGEKLKHVIREKKLSVLAPCWILVLTSERAIRFIRRSGGRLRDQSDKLWRQLIDAHLEEGFFSSRLRITFFRYDDSIVYHNPHDANKTRFDEWDFTCLPKGEARAVYTCLKEMERVWKEKRRIEQLEHDKAMGGKFIHLDKSSSNDQRSEDAGLE